MARPAERIEISSRDRAEMMRWRRSPTAPSGLAARARVVLLSGKGLSVDEVERRTGMKPSTIHKWRRRYKDLGVGGLKDLPRPGQPSKITPKMAERILTLTVERIPQEATHWSIRLMAKYAEVTEHQVRQVWIAADLKPHRLKTFKVSNDPKFAEKVVDVVGLYMDPPDNAMVLSVDEKTRVQALDRTQPMLQLKPGQIERRTHDYKRHGTASLYAAFDIATGEVIGRVTKRHRATEFLAFLRQIDKLTAQHLDLHLILDNSSTHSTPEVKRWLQRRPRFQLHFTPTSASWLNAVESWFAQLERRALYRSAFTSVQALRDELRRFIRVHNQHLAKPFTWTKTAKSIIEKVNRARTTLQNNAAN